MSVAAIGELNGDYFVTVSFCGMNTRTEEKLRSKAMKLPENYEKWVEDQAFASHSFPTKSEWIEQRGDTLMTYEVSSYVEEAFESGARAMYVKLMEDMRPAIEALKALTVVARIGDDGTQLKCTCGKEDCHSFWCSAGDTIYKLHYTDKGKVAQALAALKEKGMVE